MDHVDEGRLVLADGTKVDFRYAMIVPPFVGQEVIKAAPEALMQRRPAAVRRLRTAVDADNRASLVLLAGAGPISPG